MIFLLGIYFNDNSNALYNICKLRGIGMFTAKYIFNDLNISYNVRFKSLTQDILIKILKWVDQNKTLVKNLNHKLNRNVDQLKPVKFYRNSVK